MVVAAAVSCSVETFGESRPLAFRAEEEEGRTRPSQNLLRIGRILRVRIQAAEDINLPHVFLQWSDCKTMQLCGVRPSPESTRDDHRGTERTEALSASVCTTYSIFISGFPNVALGHADMCVCSPEWFAKLAKLLVDDFHSRRVGGPVAMCIPWHCVRLLR